MGRMHRVNGIDVPFTPTEEAQRNAEEAAWAAHVAYTRSAAYRDDILTAFLERPDGKVDKALIQVGIDKGLWTLAEIKAAHRIL